ncbi:hypothetical protein [Pasteuria penetrans]|uniref:hypothetical protein n=1 Tax=Pasteuria penetrans TaxID=86005 RepID=UPI000FC271CB|nr:hypothetical protein [Pasteuria penetrans]
MSDRSGGPKNGNRVHCFAHSFFYFSLSCIQSLIATLNLLPTPLITLWIPRVVCPMGGGPPEIGKVVQQMSKPPRAAIVKSNEGDCLGKGQDESFLLGVSQGGLVR